MSQIAWAVPVKADAARQRDGDARTNPNSTENAAMVPASDSSSLSTLPRPFNEPRANRVSRCPRTQTPLGSLMEPFHPMHRTVHISSDPIQN